MTDALQYTLRAFSGNGSLRAFLISAVILVVLGFCAGAVPALRRAWRERAARTDTWGRVATAVGPIYKLLVITLLARLLIVALVLQADSFERRFGRVTEKNRSAVLMKWGLPHEQRELIVEHSRPRIWVTRQIKLPGGKGEIQEQSFWDDEAKPVAAINGVLPLTISETRETRDVAVPQKSLAAADVTAEVKNNPRTLGHANYAGYEDLWTFAYRIVNRASLTTTAHLIFPLPAERGVFDRLVFRVDGTDVLDRSETSERDGVPALVWTMPMAPGAAATVEVSYASRGLEHLRYIPKPMTQTGHYRVSVGVDGVPPDQLDFPIGSMPPVEKLSELHRAPYKLHWNLDNALTSYDIGIKLPAPKQPLYWFASLLREAPLGLLLLIFWLAVPRLIFGQPLPLALTSLLGAAYFLFYTLMATLADWLPGFGAPFGVAAGLLFIVVAVFRLTDRRAPWLSRQDTLAFAAAAIFYPLALVDADRTALWMQAFYLSTLAYLVVLLILRRNRPAGTDAGGNI
ncbi:MAG: hypothetical protein WCL16_02520 [bacterium]